MTTIIYLFGDQTADVSEDLTQLLTRYQGPMTHAFIEVSLQHIRTAVGFLPHWQREGMPRFSDLRELLIVKRDRNLHPALEQALACVYHLVSFISYLERERLPYPTPQDTLLVGLCTGTIAASAISSCQSLAELLPVAANAVQVAFYTGACAARCGDAFYPPSTDAKQAHWSLLVPNLTSDDASSILEHFQHHACVPHTSVPWVSASAERSVTISGPPDKLGTLHRTEISDSRSSALLPIFAPYHSPAIFDQSCVESILARAGTPLLPECQSRIPIVIASERKSSRGDTLTSTMRLAVDSILRYALHWSEIVESLEALIKVRSSEKFHIVSIGTKSGHAMRGHLLGLNTVHRVDLEQVTALCKQAEATTKPKHEKIAIIGMSGRFPEADDCKQFWDILSQGLDVHKPVPDMRWSQEHIDTSGLRKNTSSTPFGCWLKSPSMFDAKFFNMSPREAPQVDPYVNHAQRLALMTAYEALEEAGLTPESTPSTQKDRVGVFYGVTSNDWMETNSAQNIDTYFIPGGNRAFIPGRINYFFKFSGPSYSIDTACSSSLAAVHLACNALWRREIDTAIAGGTNVLTNPDFTAGLDRGHFLSRTGNCRTFDDTADGYCRGEGVVSLVLKRLEDALTDNDPIRAVILGACTNHSAEAASITRPHVGAQKEVFQKILRDSGLLPADISYVEMHGTGTQAGDAGEMQSVLDTFAPSTEARGKHCNRPLHIGSAKANVGHQEAASGATSLAKILLMMEHSIIPPHCGIKTRLNRKFPSDLEDRQVFIARKATPWTQAAGRARRAFVNNFSAAGGNSGLVIEDAPPLPCKTKEIRSMLPVCISAKTKTALVGNLEALASDLDRRDGNKELLAEISYTTTARRIHYRYRALISATDIPDLRKGLLAAINLNVDSARTKTAPNIAFAFTGQGSQYFGMGKTFYAAFSTFKQDLEHFDHISRSQGFPSFLSVIVDHGQGFACISPVTTQLALTCLQIALARLWISWNINPSFVVGHSLGEYAALCIAGVLSVSDTIFLVGSRAQLLEVHCTKHSHGMLAVKCSVEKLRPLVDDGMIEIACINGPSDVVLSGHRDLIDSVEGTLDDLGIKYRVLDVPFAFHSAQVETILEDYHRIARAVRFKIPSITVLSPLRGRVEESFDADYLRDQCRNTVDFARSVEAARQESLLQRDQFVLEIGPRPIVSGMFKCILGAEVRTLSCLAPEQDCWKLMAQTLAALYQTGHNINWLEYNRDFQQNVVKLPHYVWDLNHFWIDYVHDWSLRKGDPLPSKIQKTTLTGAQQQAEQGPSVPELASSTTIHRSSTRTNLEEIRSIVVESDICRSDLSRVVRGHEVDGYPLCTPSVYADIALSVGSVLAQASNISLEAFVMAIADMNVKRALIAKSKGPQILRTTTTYEPGTKTAFCQFQSISDSGVILADHATCNIRFDGKTTLDNNARNPRRWISKLKEGLHDSKTYAFNRSMIYKCVGALASFHPGYQGLANITMDSNELEASGIVDFSSIRPEEGSFHTHPAVIDALSQVGGFVMNCNDQSDLSKEVFVNHGWGSLHIMERLSIEEVYQTHVKMRETPDKLWKGDITVLKGGMVVAKFCDIALQAVSRRLLRYILASDGGKPAEGPTSSGSPVGSTMRRAANGTSLDTKNLSLANVQSQGHSSDKEQDKTITKLMTIISEESGIAIEELTDDLDLHDLGVDSLLSLLIVSRINDELNIDFDQSSFAEMSTIQDVKASLSRHLRDGAMAYPMPPHMAPPSHTRSTSAFSAVGERLDHSQEEPQIPGGSASETTTPAKSGTPVSSPLQGKPAVSLGNSGRKHTARSVPPASSVVLQGRPRAVEKILFLLPDGSGSAHSYLDIPDVRADLTIIGLNSPFRGDGIASMQYYSLQSLTQSYVSEIRRRQPHGPYHLGGWSAGGILAYCVTQMLVRNGEHVAHLLLIDSPEPKGLDHLPQRFYDHCARTGVFGVKSRSSEDSASPPEWLMSHFTATIDMLHDYRAEPLPAGQGPRTSLIWATDCVFDGVNVAFMPAADSDTQEESEAVKFLTEKRTDFSAGYWAELFQDDQVSIHLAHGAHHFSLLHDKSYMLADFIDSALFD